MAICETQMHPSDEQIACGECDAVCVHSRDKAATSHQFDQTLLGQLARPLLADAGAIIHPSTLILRPSTPARYGKTRASFRGDAPNPSSSAAVGAERSPCLAQLSTAGSLPLDSNTCSITI